MADPTPGDAFGIRALAAKYAAIALIAGEASDGVTRARSSGAASAWVGDAGEVFRDKSHRMPCELGKANDSYSFVADALKSWADAVDDTQVQADRGLQLAREASADLVSAMAALGTARSSWSTLNAQQLTYQKLQKDYAAVPPPANVTMPTDYQLRSVQRGADQARASIAQAERRISDADARLAAARGLVLEAKSRRDDAERTAVHRIAGAQDRAVQPSSAWESIQDSAAWQTIVAVATVVLTILSIVFIIIGGPLVWALIIAATVLLIIDCLLSIAQGKNAWGELALLAIGLIPGGRLLGLADRGIEALGGMGAAGEHLASGIGAVTNAVRAGNDVVTHVIDLAGARIADLASDVAGGTLKAIHAGSADTGTLRSIFNREYKELFEVNATNYRIAPGYSTNCTRCVVAVDQTLSGAFHVAEPVFDISDSVVKVAEHYGATFADFIPHTSYNSIVETMLGLGENARGIVYGSRGILPGHVFNVVHDRNGIVFLDGQNGWFADLETFKELRLLITEAGS
jgi:hypothetical protein